MCIRNKKGNFTIIFPTGLHEEWLAELLRVKSSQIIFLLLH